MANVTIGTATILEGEWFGPTSLEYRIFSSKEWVSISGELNPLGSPFDLSLIDDVYRRGDCAVAANTVTLPAIALETTDDAVLGADTRLTLTLFDKVRNRLVAILIASFSVSAADANLGDLL
jgi:hypothetical protein